MPALLGPSGGRGGAVRRRGDFVWSSPATKGQPARGMTLVKRGVLQAPGFAALAEDAGISAAMWWASRTAPTTASWGEGGALLRAPAPGACRAKALTIRGRPEWLQAGPDPGYCLDRSRSRWASYDCAL